MLPIRAIITNVPNANKKPISGFVIIFFLLNSCKKIIR
jgi:hypothetical protein